MDKLMQTVQSLPDDQVLQTALGILPTLVKTEKSVSVLRASLLSLLALTDAQGIATCCHSLQQLAERQKSPSKDTIETETASASTAATESTPGPKFVEVPLTPGCASRSANQERLTRGDLKVEIFQKFDVDDEGFLNSVKLLCFASSMGYSATPDEWCQEYEATCRHLKCEPKQGLNFVHFSRLVDTLFNRISYCSDNELAAILDKADCRALRQLCAHASEKDAVAKANGCTTQSLVGMLSTEPRKVAEELLLAAPKRSDRVTTIASPESEPEMVREKVACSSGANVTSPSESREDLTKTLFRLLDTDGDGRVDEDEFQIVATNQGFVGNSEVWQEEFHRLCARLDANATDGLDFISFAKLVDDDTQQAWLVCTDDDLKNLCSSLTELHRKRRSSTRNSTPKRLTIDSSKFRSGRRSSDPFAFNQQKVCVNTDQKTKLRDNLKMDVFKQLDVDGDSRLNRAEMRRFASYNGFLGNREEWSAQYNLLCKEFHISSDGGLDFNLFSTLVDDESQSGCHASDAELCALLDALLMKPKVKQRLGNPPYSRQSLKVAAFDLLDVDSDKRLSREELRKFASHNGFVGNAKDWLGQYNLLCRQFHASASVGIEFKLFSRLVDDESDAGCYCSDDELVVLVQTLLD